MLKIKRPIYFLLPSLPENPDALLVLGRRAVTLEELRKLFKRGSSVGNERQPSVFSGVELSYVDVDEPNCRILKSRLRSGGAIRVSRTNSDDQAGVAGQEIGSRSTCYTHGPQAQCVIVRERSFSGLRFGDRDSR